MTRLRLGSERLLGQQQPGAGDLLVQGPVLLGVDLVDTPREHSHRAAAERALVNRSVDAPRETGGDEEPRLGQCRGEVARQAFARQGGVARAHHGDRGARQQAHMPDGRQDRRRIVDRRQGARVVALASAKQAAIQLRKRGELLLRRRLLEDAQRLAAATPTREFGQGIERGRSAAIGREQVPKGDRAHILAADEPQPVEPFLVGESARP